MQSIVPSRRPGDERLAVALGAQRRVHLQPGVEVLADRLVGQRQVVRAGLGGDLHAAALASATASTDSTALRCCMCTRPSSYPAIAASRATNVDSEMLGIP
jgi:hypothetical protein